MGPSPYTHLYRLGLLSIIGLIAFLTIRYFSIPESWDSDAWYRKDALLLLQQQEPIFGGNESCAAVDCHEDDRYLIDDARSEHQLRIRWLEWATHKTLACESCHGPLGKHVQDGLKVQKAITIRESKLCLRCHEKRLGRNAIVTFRENEYHESLSVTKESLCVECHDPHEPK
uniref:Doubled CXXCH domain-containing protein n=1 Tax=Candidatus Kentrum sp. TUN TaxID=2126343 RepID=A0A450ZMN3_9GAMM|nr:MAG: doubled CXXCH domain-containing protein [Candidatus Kentron sp. TUN]VFK53578.1 MAG: doubled CXXCH domain-containing protein [Candidatus Kentron sp. TUN]VFK55044.1 MAG: doubled CXXCH domain-containing protein [Candidatus Kentron sp. TUN]